MRFILYGAGAIGGVIGGRLFDAGHDVVLIARGRHHDEIRAHGLRLESPDAAVVLPIPVVADPRAADLTSNDIVVLAVKSHDTPTALRSLAAAGPPDVAVVCAQNGVENERAALRRFPNVYGMTVMCPTLHLEPGLVRAYSAPTTGILDVGRVPSGIDSTVDAVAVALRSATFLSEPETHIMRWKYAKLLTNLGNAIEAVCGPAGRRGVIGDLARSEGEACLRAAGIDFASVEEDRARRGDHLRVGPINGARRPGGSSWQSLARATGGIETDYINGEIVLLGRLHGIPTPVNELLCRLANGLAGDRRPPGAVAPEDFVAMLPPDVVDTT